MLRLNVCVLKFALIVCFSNGDFILLAVFPLPGQKRPCQGQSGFHCHFRGLIVLARGQWPVFFCPDENLGPTGARGVVMNNIK